MRSLAVGLAMVSAASAQQSAEPERYAPPVHVQPAAYSVVESEAELHSDVQQATAMAPVPYTQGAHLANMSQYMQMQNQAALMAKDAQVNAALYQLQRSQAAAAHTQAAPRSAPRPQYAYPAPVAQQAPAPRVQPRRQQAAPAKQVRVANQSIRIERPQSRRVAAVPQNRNPAGLQDRISQAFRSKFTRPPEAAPVRRVTPPTPTVAVARQQTPRQQPPRQKQVQLVQHTSESELDDLLPELAPTPARVEQPRQQASKPKRAPKMAYRPRKMSNEKVIVPSFVEPSLDPLPELQLTAAQTPIGSGVRRPRVESRSHAMSYGAKPLPEISIKPQPEVSIFKNSSTQDEVDDDPEISERLRQIDDDLKSNRQRRGDSELPQRPTEDRSLLDLEDKKTEAEALRRRQEIDAELDALEDDEEDILDDDVIDEDEDEDPPVYDERGCQELRDLFFGETIRDISLDVSPPASPRRFEIGSLTRSWNNAAGIVVGTGTMVDLRRGYVILDSGVKLPYAKLSESDQLAIAENWLLPSGCGIGNRGTLGRHWAPQTVTWHASSLCHKPLYFENVQLERYGHSRGPFAQPVHSTLHFFGSLFFLPYQTALHPPTECQYSLGYYRPGSCAPWLVDPIPFSRDGIRRQALVATGAAFYP